MGRGGVSRGWSGLVMRHFVEMCVFEQSQVEETAIFDTHSQEPIE